MTEIVAFSGGKDSTAGFDMKDVEKRRNTGKD